LTGPANRRANDAGVAEAEMFDDPAIGEELNLHPVRRLARAYD